MYFSYDPGDHELFFHDTEKEAKKTAQADFAWYESNTCEGWDDAIEDVCYGKVLGRAIEINRRPAPEGALYKEVVEYELKEVQMKKD